MQNSKLIELFEHAVGTQNPSEVTEAINSTFLAPTPIIFVPYLCQLLEFKWHFNHEDIARLLQEIGDPESVNSLLKTATAKFDYLGYDDSKSLSRKCIWAIADIGNNKAKEALIELSKNEDEVIAEFARKRIDNWERELNRKKHFS